VIQVSTFRARLEHVPLASIAFDERALLVLGARPYNRKRLNGCQWTVRVSRVSGLRRTLDRWIDPVVPVAEPRLHAAVGVLTGQLRDVLVTATFHKADGPPGGGYGIIVRDQGPGSRDGLNQGGHYYVLEVGDSGEVGIWRRDEDQ